ncbi:MAG: MFS transporter [Symbiobacteriia bacterium]
MAQSAIALSDTAFLVLMVPYVQRVLHGGAGAAGVLEASLSGGIVLASAVAARKFWDAHPLLTWSTVPLFCLATAMLALAPNLALAVAFQVIAGFAIGVFNIRAQTMFQQVVEDQHLGNTLALRGALLSVVQSGGAVLAGGLAAGVGVAFVFLSFGLAGAGISAATIWYTHAVARTARLQEREAE